MNPIKQILKDFLPPIILFGIRKFKKPVKPSNGWSGNYASWEEAKKSSTGYDKDVILERVKNAILKVKNGEAVFERDSVLFDKPTYNCPLLPIFLKVAKENQNELEIIDFGGSLGSTYFQYKPFLSHLNKIEWNVVEQANFVKCGKEYITTDELLFHESIENVIKKNKPKILLLSSVIQYIDEPKQLIEKIISYNFDYIIFDRTAFIKKSDDLLTIQSVPEYIYKASYPAWFFNYEKFIIPFSQSYNAINTFTCNITKPMIINCKEVYWMGIIFEKK